MNAAGYFQAAIPEPFRILGLELKPLSLGRYRLLKRFDCAFVADEARNATIPDLILGVLVCSMRVDEFLAFINSGKLSKEVRKWGRKICPHPWIGKLPWMGKRWREKHSFNVIEKFALFNRYIKLHSEYPDYFEESEDGKSSGAHWCHALDVTLRSELGWNEEEINEEPLSKGLFSYFKFAEAQGSIRLMSEADVKMGKENANVFAL